MDYRREIDGLRALAVLPVILFHAGMQIFSGGFVGVDVFFIISGFLITTHILEEKYEGTFSLVRFYERRVRRILPALFFVMLVCLPFAWFWLLPTYLRDFSRSLYYVSIFGSNILFSQRDGYFDSASEMKPLLHTWSLGVEEQFYLLFPLFLLLIWRFGFKWIGVILLTCATISLAAAEHGLVSSPSMTFFRLPTRAWELLAGSLLALYLFRRPNVTQDMPKAVSQVGGVLGILLILASILGLDESVPFPGIYALLPTMGALLIILFARPNTLAGKILGSKPLVGIGLISYSAYLWHQPLFAFARHIKIGEPSTALMLGLTVASLVLAALSWRFIEKPFRDRSWIGTRTIFVAALCCSLFFITIGRYGDKQQGFPDRLSPEQQQINSFISYSQNATLTRSGSCMIDKGHSVTPFAPECMKTNQDQPVTLVWGDSHAAALSIGLRHHLPNVVQLTMGGCAASLDAVMTWKPRCKETNDYILGVVEQMQPANVVLAGNWKLHYIKSHSIAITETIRRIHEVSPASRVIVVGSMPQWDPSLPATMLQKQIKLQDGATVKVPLLGMLQDVDRYVEANAKAAGARYFSPIDHLCRDGECQAVAAQDGKVEPLVWDYGHLTEAGSGFLSGLLIKETMPGI